MASVMVHACDRTILLRCTAGRSGTPPRRCSSCVGTPTPRMTSSTSQRRRSRAPLLPRRRCLVTGVQPAPLSHFPKEDCAGTQSDSVAAVSASECACYIIECHIEYHIAEHRSTECPAMCARVAPSPGAWVAGDPAIFPRISRTAAAPQQSRADAVCHRWRDAGSAARWSALRTAWLPLQGGWKALWWDAVAVPPDVRDAGEFREGARWGAVLSPAWCARGPFLKNMCSHSTGCWRVSVLVGRCIMGWRCDPFQK